MLIDAGNSFIKLLSEKKIKKLKTAEVINRPQKLLDLLEEENYAVSVVKEIDQILQGKAVFPFRKKRPKFAYPGMGEDRMACIVALLEEGLGSFLIVSIGTAVTLDIVKDRRYRGGMIMPGPSLLLKCLATQTSLLPEVKFEPSWQPGSDTVTCIKTGVFRMMVASLSTIIQEIDLRPVVLTGGGAKLLKNFIPHQIFKENLALEGLKAWISNIK